MFFLNTTVKDNSSLLNSFPLWFVIVAGAVVILTGVYLLSKFLESSKSSQEKDCSLYTLEEAIEWFKVEKPSVETHLRGCLLKDNLSGRRRLKLTHCFVNSQGQPLLDDNYPILIVKTDNISSDLEDLFGEKIMLILT